MNSTNKPADSELAAIQLRENRAALAEGRKPRRYWLDPCREVDFSDFERNYLAPARALREAAAREQL